MDSKDQQNNKEGQKLYTTQPVQPVQGEAVVDPKFAAVQAPPGPIFVQDMPPVEGTAEERQARKEELNRKK